MNVVLQNISASRYVRNEYLVWDGIDRVYC